MTLLLRHLAHTPRFLGYWNQLEVLNSDSENEVRVQAATVIFTPFHFLYFCSYVE